MTPWTVAGQAPLSMGISRQEYWSGLPFTSPEDLPDLGIEPRSPALQADSLPSEPPGKPYCIYKNTSLPPISLSRDRYRLYNAQVNLTHSQNTLRNEMCLAPAVWLLLDGPSSLGPDSMIGNNHIKAEIKTTKQVFNWELRPMRTPSFFKMMKPGLREVKEPSGVFMLLSDRTRSVWSTF